MLNFMCQLGWEVGPSCLVKLDLDVAVHIVFRRHEYLKPLSKVDLLYFI